MVTITLTRRWEGMAMACRISQATFLEAGFVSDNASGMRMIPQYLNRGTTAVVASWDGEPVGSFVMVADGPFGLPSDRAFIEENDAVRARAPRMFEIGSFGVLASHRTHTRDLANAAFAACFIVLDDAGAGTFAVAAVEPKLVRFYDNLFGMSSLCEQERPMYGAPAGLCGADVAVIDAALSQPRGAQRRRIHQLIGERDEWLVDERPLGGGLGTHGQAIGASEWAPAQITQLLADNGQLERLEQQRDALAGLWRSTPGPRVAATDKMSRMRMPSGAVLLL